MFFTLTFDTRGKANKKRIVDIAVRNDFSPAPPVKLTKIETIIATIGYITSYRTLFFFGSINNKQSNGFTSINALLV